MDRHLYLLLVHGSISISERAGAPHWATPIRQSSMFAILLGQFFTVIVWSVMLCVYSIFCALCYSDTSESPKEHFFRVGWPLGSSLVVTFERCLRANNRNRTEIPKGITLLRPQETLVGQIAILNKSPLWCCFSMFSFFKKFSCWISLYHFLQLAFGSVGSSFFSFIDKPKPPKNVRKVSLPQCCSI